MKTLFSLIKRKNSVVKLAKSEFWRTFSLSILEIPKWFLLISCLSRFRNFILFMSFLTVFSQRRIILEPNKAKGAGWFTCMCFTNMLIKEYLILCYEITLGTVQHFEFFLLFSLLSQRNISLRVSSFPSKLLFLLNNIIEQLGVFLDFC